MILRQLFLLVICLMLNFTAISQQLPMRLAESHMQRFEYKAAIEIYEKILERNQDNLEAKTQLAKAYHKIKQTKNAEYWYSQIVFYPDIEPINYLHYAQMLQRNGKCGIAKQWFQKYAKVVPDDLRGQFQARSCDYVAELMSKNADLYEVNRLWFNSTGDDFSPTFYKDDLVITSDRSEISFVKKSAGWGEKPFLNLYHLRMVPSDTEVSTTCNFIYTKPKLIDDPINSPFHDASAVYTKDANEVFITRSGAPENLIGANEVQNLQLYYSRIMRGDWIAPILLPFNDKQHSVAHPALSPDEKYLFFSSDMPGGYGGMDLYVVERIQNRWGEPINLGRQINSEGDEVFPTCDQSGRLYFASDGWIGLGGLDIYSTEKIQDQSWSPPENLGFPMNTIADDFGIIFNNEGTCGYFSSNRSGGKGGDDIYSFVKNSATLQILVYDQQTGQPLDAALIQEDCNNYTFLTNSDGRVVFDMLLNKCCAFKATLQGYENAAVQGCTKSLTAGQNVYIEIPMQQQVKFTLRGSLFDEYTGLPINSANIDLRNDCGKAVKSLRTDASGLFTFELEKECCYTILANHSNYVNTVKATYCTKGLSSSKHFPSKLYLKPRSK